MKTRLATIAAALLAPTLAFADAEVQSHAFDGSFDDAAFAVESAIIDRGLVIDYVSHVGAMLARTKADVEGSADLFQAADVFLFCSAVLSREVMEADPMNIAHCPYGIFVAETTEGVRIGYRTYPEGPMKAVEALLDEIAREAAGAE